MRSPTTVATLTILTLACLAAHPAAAGVGGVYTTTTPTGTFTLTLDQGSGGEVTGTLVGAGLNVTVSGTVAGTVTTGLMSAAQGRSTFRAEPTADGLTLTVVDPDGSVQQFAFRRLAAAPATPGGAAAPPAARPEAPPGAELAADEIGDPSWGLVLKVPVGWIHQQRPEGIVLGSNSEKGLILVLPHSYGTLAELRSAAAEGLVEEGVQLTPSGPLEAFGDNGLAAEYEGVAEGRPAKAFAVALLSPHGGGATILTAVESSSYSPAYRRRVEAMARSVRFSRPAAPPAMAGWQQKLAGHCLAYLSSSSSSGPSYGGYSTGGYTSSKSRYYLYPDGSFEGSSSSSVSIDTGGAFGSSAGGSGPRAGRWQVVSVAGQAVLDLRYPDGSQVQHRLSSDDKGHTLLDGVRWFVVSYQECNDL